jgi:hypothetical protein
MQPSVALRYWRRLDGSYACICLRCYRTASAAKAEEESDELNKNHVCDPETLVSLSDIVKRSMGMWGG